MLRRLVTRDNTIQVQLPDKVVIYEIDSDDPNDMMYHQKVCDLWAL